MGFGIESPNQNEKNRSQCPVPQLPSYRMTVESPVQVEPVKGGFAKVLSQTVFPK